MRNKHTITITIHADETDSLRVQLDEIRASLGQTIAQDYSVFHDQHGYDQVASLVTGFTIDGRTWDGEHGRLSEHPKFMDDEVLQHLRDGRKIQAIKLIRENSANAGTPLGLGEAKALADNWKP